MNEKHYLAIDMLSEVKRLTRAEITKKLGISRMMLWKWMQRKDFMKALDKEIRRKVNERMKRFKGVSLADAALSGDMRSVERIMRAADMIP